MSEPALQQAEALSIDELLDNFELLGDWDSKYAYLVELGDALPVFPDDWRQEVNQVQGCMSQVWVRPVQQNESDKKLFYSGDSDTPVIKGVLAVLIGLFSGNTAQQVQQIDVETLFEQLGLKENLSPNRHVGVYAMVKLMQEQANEFGVDN